MVLTGLMMLALLIGLVWWTMQKVPANWARAWALLATMLLPVAIWAGWWFGHTEARGRLAGIDQAVDKVMGAASRTAGLRVDTSRAMRRTVVQEPPPAVVMLPDVEIVPRRLVRGGNGDVIEL